MYRLSICVVLQMSETPEMNVPLFFSSLDFPFKQNFLSDSLAQMLNHMFERDGGKDYIRHHVLFCNLSGVIFQKMTP